MRSTCACQTGTVAAIAVGSGVALNRRHGAMTRSRAVVSHRDRPSWAARSTERSASLLAATNHPVGLQRTEQQRWFVGDAAHEQVGAVLLEAVPQRLRVKAAINERHNRINL